jgi:hypothetical protein
MKKSKLLILGLIVLMLAGGLALASCRAGCEGAGSCGIDYDGRTTVKGSTCSDSSCGVMKEVAKGKKGVFKCDC